MGGETCVVGKGWEWWLTGNNYPRHVSVRTSVDPAAAVGAQPQIWGPQALPRKHGRMKREEGHLALFRTSLLKGEAPARCCDCELGFGRDGGQG